MEQKEVKEEKIDIPLQELSPFVRKGGEEHNWEEDSYGSLSSIQCFLFLSGYMKIDPRGSCHYNHNCLFLKCMKTAVFSFIAPAFFLFLPSVFALSDVQTTSSGNDVYISGEIEEIGKYVPGDLMLAGRSMEVRESVGQDLTAAGFVVKVFGDVGDDARIGGYDVVVAGNIGDSLIAAAQNVIVRSGSTIGGDAWIGAESIQLNGPVEGDVRLAGEVVEINDRIAGNAKISAKTLIFGQAGYIAGDLDLTAPNKVSEVNVGGEYTFNGSRDVYKYEQSSFERKVRWLWSPFSLVFFLTILAVGGLLIHFLRNYFIRYAELSKSSPFVSMGIGFLMFITFPIGALFLALTVLGIPLAGLAILVYFAALLVASIVDGLVVGSFLFPVSKKSSYWHIFGLFTLGSLIIYLLPLVPYIGNLAAFLIFLISLGTLGRCHRGLYLALKKGKKV